MSDETYGWDDERIDNPDESSFTLLPKGDYPFTVTKFERGEFNGSDNMPACKKAIITIKIDGGALGETTAKENLFLVKKLEWKLCQFFTAIGLRKSGDPLILAWNQIVGRGGTLKLGQETYNEVTRNRVTAFLEPSPGAVTAPAPTPTPAPAPPVQQQMAAAVAAPGTSQYDDGIPF